MQELLEIECDIADLLDAQGLDAEFNIIYEEEPADALDANNRFPLNKK